MSVKQLVLPFDLSDTACFKSYIATNNQWAVNALQQWSLGQTTERLCVCWGPLGSGRTHLLNASCQTALLSGQRVFYLDCLEAIHYQPCILEDLSSIGLVCLDNVDVVLGQLEWEKALFHLYNEMIVTGQGRLLWSVTVSPEHLNVVLKDLHSRLLSWVLSLLPLSEQALSQALVQRAHQRGFVLTVQASQYILKYLSCCTHCVFKYLDQLDQHSLRDQRRVTIPFLKRHAPILTPCAHCQKGVHL